MRSFVLVAFLFVTYSVSNVAMAQYSSKASGDASDLRWLYFQHKDWELACDNTRTCRAAGYQAGDSVGPPASVLLSRAAGASTVIKIRFQAQDDRSGDEVKGKFNLRLANTTLGVFSFDTDLTDAQARELLPKLFSGKTIELVQGTLSWQISLAGLNAVALKMDEAQKRVGTIGAMLSSTRGTKNESNVAQPLPKPTINVPKIPPQDGSEKLLLNPIKAALGKTGCSEKAPTISLSKLNDTVVLVELNPCERAAYNAENAYFIANIKAPHSPKRIKLDDAANEFSQGVISGFYKGRGVGDCISTLEFAWNGARFVKANASGSGMCRGFPGGAWDMPTVVSNIVNENTSSVTKKSK